MAKKLFGWALSILGAAFAIAKIVADLVGHSTFPEDASDLVRKMTPLIEFLQQQNDLWFYAFQAALVVIGIALLFGQKISSAIRGVKQPPASVKEKPVRPPTLHEISKSDFPECLKISNSLSVKGAHQKGDMHLCINSHAHSKFLVVYLPHTEHAVTAIREISSDAVRIAGSMHDGVQILTKEHGDIADVDLSKIPFVNRVVVYHESRLSLQDAAELVAHYAGQGLTLVLRGSDYVTARWFAEKAK